MAETRPRHQIWLVIALAMSCALPLILPSDAPWIFDEPQLLENAVLANHSAGVYFGVVHLPFTILSVGLSGTRGAWYGPGAEWFYQIMVAALPHNLVLLCAVRAAVVSIATAGGLFWLSRASGLSLKFAVAIMLSPWLWFYSRELWDNSFCIPLSVLALAAYAGFLKTHSRGALAATIVCLFFLALVHLMSVALIAPIVLHLLIFQTRWLIRFRRTLLATVLVMSVISLPYFSTFYMNYQFVPLRDLSPWRGWIYPLFGGNHLSAIGLNHQMGWDWPGFVKAAVWFSGIAYIAVWIGMILAVPRVRRVIRHEPDCSVLDHIAAISICVWVFQSILDGLQRVYDMPHYYNATWIAYAVFAWLAVDALPRVAVSRLVIPAYAACQLVVIGFVLARIHIDGGTHSQGYGSTIGNQQQIADDIGNNIPDIECRQWRAFPVAYEALRILRPPAASDNSVPRHVVVQYRDAFRGDARIVIVEAPLPATRPADKEGK